MKQKQAETGLSGPDCHHWESQAHPNSVEFENDVLALDVSQSMGEAGFTPGQSKQQLLREACIRLVDIKCELFPDTNLSVIVYSTNATVLVPLVNVRAHRHRILQALDAMMTMPHGGTEMYKGLRHAQALLEAQTGFFSWALRKNCPRARVIALSDGHDQAQPQALRIALALKARGVLIETLGIERDRASVSEEFLRQVATTDGEGFTHYRFLGDGDSVYETFEQLGAGTLTFEG